MYATEQIRNIAIIAHVDHGKTTIIDSMLQQSGTFRDNQQVDICVMDSGDLEKERGITIMAKCTSIKIGDMKVNIIDTPGHADFGGEVERILSMVDSVLLLVDSYEGVMPQTKFVLSKALKLGLKPIVIINKIDKPEARCEEVVNAVFDLFCTLDANDEQLDFPIIYASGRSGYAKLELADESKDLQPLFNKILAHVGHPKGDAASGFTFLGTLLDSDPFVGRMLVGKIYSGTAKVNSTIKVLNREGGIVERGRITKLFTFNGVTRVSVEQAVTGDIVMIAGITKASVGDTICADEITVPLQSQPIDPPTISITLSVNTSPLSGQDGNKLTSTVLQDRLYKEAEYNVAIKVEESPSKNGFELSGRGELQLGVIIETMRREGFEMSVGRPRVIFKKDKETGKVLEPIEETVIDVDSEYSGAVVKKLGIRKGEMQDMRESAGGKTRIVFHIPSRGLIGYRNEFLNDTRGTGVLNSVFMGYQPFKGEIEHYRNGVLLSTTDGEAVAYAIFNLQDRGTMFVSPQDKVYVGMIVGEHNRDNDLEINITKGKQLTNVRASGTDEAVRLITPRALTLEQMISYIAEDEMIEVTPHFLRMRKVYLDPNDRKKYGRSKKDMIISE